MLHSMAWIGSQGARGTGRERRIPVRSLLARLAERVQEWRDAKRAQRELNSLGDHELHDLGITRGDIDFVVRRGGSANDNHRRRAA